MTSLTGQRLEVMVGISADGPATKATKQSLDKPTNQAIIVNSCGFGDLTNKNQESKIMKPTILVIERYTVYLVDCSWDITSTNGGCHFNKVMEPENMQHESWNFFYLGHRIKNIKHEKSLISFFWGGHHFWGSIGNNSSQL
jgi:hypothetical protein